MSASRLPVAAAGCAVAFAAVVGAVSLGWTHGLDAAGRPASAWAVGHGLVPTLLTVETAFARTAVSVYAVVLACALLVRREVGAAVLVAVSTAATAAATTALKSLGGRARPPWQVADRVLHGGSLPSGHASATAALAASMVLVALRLGGRTAAVVAALGGGSTYVLVAGDRVLLGRHYPTDVVGGLLVGVAVTCLVARGVDATRSAAIRCAS